MFHQRLALLIVLSANLSLAAQVPDNVVRLTLHPAPEPSPALKYQLLPDVPDQIPGNAVVHYYRAFSPDWYNWRNQPKLQQKIDAAFEALVSDISAKEWSWLTGGGQLRELDLGARSAYCDWQLTERVRENGLTILLPDMQNFRELNKLLALRARIEIANRNYDKAVYSLQTGLELSRQIADAPLVICALVGANGAELQLTQLEALIQAPGSPNMYWALTGLPRPYLDLRKALGGENLFLFGEMPLMKNIETRRLSLDETAALARQFCTLIQRSESGSMSRSDEVFALFLAAQIYPAAKQRLLTQGWKAADIEALPAVQVIAIDAYRTYVTLRDDCVKWFSLPYIEAFRGLERAESNLRQSRSESLLSRALLDLIAPSPRLLYVASRLERRIAALRTIEAIRLYAAANDGRLPAALADIKVVPVPDDPITGRPFGYKQNGNQFTLSGPALAPETPNSAVQYEATLTR